MVFSQEEETSMCVQITILIENYLILIQLAFIFFPIFFLFVLMVLMLVNTIYDKPKIFKNEITFPLTT